MIEPSPGAVEPRRRWRMPATMSSFAAEPWWPSIPPRTQSSLALGEELGYQKVLLATEGNNRGDSGVGGAGRC